MLYLGSRPNYHSLHRMRSLKNGYPNYLKPWIWLSLIFFLYSSISSPSGHLVTLFFSFLVMVAITLLLELWVIILVTDCINIDLLQHPTNSPTSFTNHHKPNKSQWVKVSWSTERVFQTGRSTYCLNQHSPFRRP